MAATDPEQLKNLGFLGIFKEAYKLTFSRWKPIFFRITLALILPFCLIYFADMYLSNYLSWNVYKHHIDLDDTWSDNPRYDQLKHKLVREWTAFWVLNCVFFILGILVFYLFSISAIVYTVACIYTAEDKTFKQVMRVVPKAWKKLVITFFWNVLIMFVYNIVALILLVLSIVLARSSNLVLGITLCIIIVILYLLGLVYINVIWQMACVVSVLEDKCGLRAMKKSRDLLKGKMMVAIGIFVAFQMVLIGIQGGYYAFVSLGGSVAVVVHVVVGVVCFMGLLKLVVMGLVVQSIVYFVCKSYHHESIDKEYEQLGKDVQLGQLSV